MHPMPGEVEEAKQHPNGWVYRIQGVFAPNDAVPPEAIVGAWKVDGEGKIVGEFVPNLKFSGAGKEEKDMPATEGGDIRPAVRVILAVLCVVLLAGGVVTAVFEKNWKVTGSGVLLGGLFAFLAWSGRTPKFLR